MATTKKKKGRGKKKKTGLAGPGQAKGPSVDPSEKGGGDEEPEEDAGSVDKADDAAAAPEKKPKADAGGGRKLKGRARTRANPDVIGKELIPSADGPNVSKGGGLVFVAVVLGLIGVAIVAQFLMGN